MTLAGPQRLLVSAAKALQGGVPVVQPPSGFAEAQRAALEALIASSGRTLRWVAPQARGLGAIAAALELSNAPTPEEVLLGRQYRYFVLQVEAECPEIRRWTERLLKLSTQQAKPEGIALWYVCPPDAGLARRADNRYCWLKVEESIGPVEMHVAAAHAFQDNPGPGPTRYWESLALELGGPDYQLIEQLVHLSPKDMLQIEQTLLKFPAGVAAIPYAGGAFVPSTVLARWAAANDDKARALLRRRIWKAQMREFMPAMEEVRCDFLQQFMPLLQQIQRNPPKLRSNEKPRDPLPDKLPDDLEYGPAAYWLGNHPRARAKSVALFLFQKVRNDLAHQRVLEPATLADLLTTAAAEFRGEWASRGVNLTL